MANAADLLKGNVGTGILIGIGVVAIAPIVAPALAAGAKPLIKSLIKTGILAYEKGREALAETGEAFEDLVAEAAAELGSEESKPNGESAPKRAKPATARA